MFGSWRRQLGAWAWITPIGLVLSLFAGYYVATNTPTTYMATRQVLFISKPTSNPEVGYEVNPFLSFGASLYTAASVVAISVTDERSTKEIIPPGSQAQYTVTEQPGGSVPVLNIEATAPTPTEVDIVADTVVDRIALVLADEQKQAKAPKETWIVSSLIGSSLDPARVWKKNIVFGIAAAAAVIAATLMLLLMVIWSKQLLARRRRKQAERLAAAPPEQGPEASLADDQEGSVPASDEAAEPAGATADEEPPDPGAPGASEPTAAGDPAGIGPELSGTEAEATPQPVGSGGPTGRAE